jgi:hypothetical protein
MGAGYKNDINLEIPNSENAIAGPIISPKGIAKYHLKSKWKSITIAGRINKVADCVDS